MDARKVQVIPGSVAVALLIGALTACGKDEPPPATTQTTSAKLVVERAEVARAERERDQARAALAMERARVAQQEAVRTSAEADNHKQRDELATKAWNALDNADDELLPLKEAAATISDRDRDRIEGIIDEALKKKGHVKANLKALTCDGVLDWALFKTQTEQAINALDNAVRAARADVMASSSIVPAASGQPAPAKARTGRTKK